MVQLLPSLGELAFHLLLLLYPLAHRFCHDRPLVELLAILAQASSGTSPGARSALGPSQASLLRSLGLEEGPGLFIVALFEFLFDTLIEGKGMCTI